MSILIGAVGLGLLLTIIRVVLADRPLNPPNLQLLWLLPIAVSLQLILLRFGNDGQAALGLTISQFGLLVFVAINLCESGFLALGLGLSLNFLVITLNGGLMPISPEMVAHLYGPNSFIDLQVGTRLYKDIIIPISETRLYFLSDRFYLNVIWADYAFSLGDVFIAWGAFWAVFATSKKKNNQGATNTNEWKCFSPTRTGSIL